jgi:hypothetical protein
LGPNLRFMLPTVAPGKNSGVLRIASSVLHIFLQTAIAPDSGAPAALVIGQKAAQERFSEESFRHRTSPYRKRISQKPYRKFPHTSAGTHGTQQAWINSRNLTNIATEWKHRQPIFLHPTIGTGAIRQSWPLSTLDCPPSERLLSGKKDLGNPRESTEPALRARLAPFLAPALATPAC